MPVCIAGMHRSGTSMVARLLYHSGVYLGEDTDLMSAAPDNPEGFWENVKFVRINDEILAYLKSGWDFPPVAKAGWERSKALKPLLKKGQALLQQFEGHESWGWKDPRNSLTLPFWKQLIPDLKIILCLRNPLEVAQSLAHRGYSSNVFSINLWRTYNQRLINAVPTADRLITHYDAYSIDPETELRRLLAFVGFSNKDETIKAAAATFSPTMHHNRSHLEDLVRAHVPDNVVDMYIKLCLNAGPGYLGSNIDLHHVVELNNTQEQYSVNSEAGLLIRLVEREHTMRDLSTQLAEKERAFPLLSSQVVEQTRAVETLTARLAEQEQTTQILSSQVFEQAQAVDILKTQLAKKDQELHLLSSLSDEKEESVRTLTTQLAEQKQEIQSLSSRARESEQIAKSLTNQLAEKEKVKQLISEEVIEKDRMICRHLAALADDQEKLAALFSQTSEKDESIHTLLAQTEQLRQTIDVLSTEDTKIKKSTGWKIIWALWQIRLFLAPSGSQREKAIHFVKASFRNTSKTADTLINQPVHNRNLKTIAKDINKRQSKVTDQSSSDISWNLNKYNQVSPLECSETVDIIICVGPMSRTIAACMESIRQSTEHDAYRIHLVAHNNDIPGLQSEFPETDIISHTMGLFNFARANNIAIRQCKGDVVLLNDDTIVSPEWLERLKNDSRGYALTGSHTDFQCSGNPDMWGRGPAALTQFPINMFCIYIPRRVLDVVGFLDEEFAYYGGEDVDYSCRAIQNGFPLIISSAFVEHKNNRSYGESKQLLIEESDKIIKERFGIGAPYELDKISPKISVIVATRNRPELLVNAVTSIRDGYYHNQEIIIVDDHSSSATQKAINDLQAQDKRVINIKLAQHVGMTKARDMGINIAHGSFIAFSDDDDLVYPNRLIAPLNHIMKNPSLDAVYCNFNVLTEQGNIVSGSSKPFDINEFLDMKFPIGSGMLLIRKKLLEEVPFMSTYDHAVDFDWVFRVVRKGFNIDYCPDIVTLYNRQGPADSHLSGNQTAIQSHAGIRQREAKLSVFRR